MPKQKRDPIEYLFKARKNVAPDQYGKVIPVKKMLCSTAFFPGGSGLWNKPPKKMLPRPLRSFHAFFSNSKSPSIPKKKIMILGNDFGSKDGYKKVQDNPYKNLTSSSTWHNLLPLLKAAGIKPKHCFFTNAYMGLRRVGKDTGPSPGAADPKFVERCESFFLNYQIPTQEPRLILALGEHSIDFIAGLSCDLTEWKRCKNFKELDGLGPVKSVSFNGSKSITVVALLHPSTRHGNARHRGGYKGQSGTDAELKMLKDALKKSGLR